MSTIEGGLNAAFNRKRAKLAAEQRKQGKGGRHNVIDLTIPASKIGVVIPNDSSQQQRPNAPRGKSLKSTINDNSNAQPIFTTVNESKTGGVMPDYNSSSYRDEYSRYDPEPNADQLLINSGATIISSTIEVNGRLIVRPKDYEYY